jgi:hypothetical protein
VWLYASQEAVREDNLALTFVQTTHPKALLDHLTKNLGHEVKEWSPGLYRTDLWGIPLQIIESQKLDSGENPWLAHLRTGLTWAEFREIWQEASKKGVSELGPYWNALFIANKKIFQEVKGNHMLTPELEEVLRESGVMTAYEDVALARGREEGLGEGLEKGREEGIEVVARNMLQSGMGAGWIAKMTGLSEERVEALGQSMDT